MMLQLPGHLQGGATPTTTNSAFFNAFPASAPAQLAFPQSLLQAQTLAAHMALAANQNPPRPPEELAAAQLLLSVSPACRPVTRPRSFSLEALCDAALCNPQMMNGLNAAPSVVLSPGSFPKSVAAEFQQTRSLRNSTLDAFESTRSILATLKRNAEHAFNHQQFRQAPQQRLDEEDDDDEDYVIAKRTRRTSRQSASRSDKRIGAYTMQERQEKIARFLDKRDRRIWTKKVRYSCRKNLAECRTRVKGRFVSSKGQDA